MTPSLFPVISIILTIVLYILHRLLSFPYDPREPPLIKPAIPWFGHLIGLLSNGSRYYSRVADGCGKPIFTLGLPRGKMYVVTSPDLVAACDRRARIVSFAPYVVEFGRRILLASQRGVDLLSEDLLEERGASSLRPETMKAMHQSLKPGHTLNDMTQDVLKNFIRFLDSTDDINDANGLSLFPWIRRFVATSSTDAIYGLKNPMKNTEVMDSLWAIDEDFALLGLMLFPDYVAPKGSTGRKVFFDAFDKYYAEGGLDTASHLIKARYKVNRKHGVSNRDIAQFDLGVCTALLINTVPAVFWTLWHVFSDPFLLTELRQGIEAEILDQTDGYAEASTTTVNIPKVIEAFPLLESLVKEVLRMKSSNASARSLLKDTLVQDGGGATYLLKEGSSLVMPAAPVHYSEAVWGTTARDFDPARFAKLKQEGRRVVASAWRTFGGGNSLCPGRHFALHEIMSIVIVMVLKYDLEPMDGTWKKPETKHHISTSILTPVDDVRVRILPRKDERAKIWNLVWEPGTSRGDK